MPQAPLSTSQPPCECARVILTAEHSKQPTNRLHISLTQMPTQMHTFTHRQAHMPMLLQMRVLMNMHHAHAHAHEHAHSRAHAHTCARKRSRNHTTTQPRKHVHTHARTHDSMPLRNYAPANPSTHAIKQVRTVATTRNRMIHWHCQKPPRPCALKLCHPHQTVSAGCCRTRTHQTTHPYTRFAILGINNPLMFTSDGTTSMMGSRLLRCESQNTRGACILCLASAIMVLVCATHVETLSVDSVFLICCSNQRTRSQYKSTTHIALYSVLKLLLFTAQLK